MSGCFVLLVRFSLIIVLLRCLMIVVYVLWEMFWIVVVSLRDCMFVLVEWFMSDSVLLKLMNRMVVLFGMNC